VLHGSGTRRRRLVGGLSSHAPRYDRWRFFEAEMNCCDFFFASRFLSITVSSSSFMFSFCNYGSELPIIMSIHSMPCLEK
jgi:hypothetical protein